MTKSALHRIIEQGYDLAESTRERYLRDLDVWIQFAGTDPKNWTSTQAQEFYSFLLGRMEPQSANRAYASLAYASRWYAQTHQVQDFAIIRKISIQPDEDSIRHALTAEDAQRLLTTCLGDHPICLRDMAMMVVGLETGMRRMSLRSLSFETIDTSSSNPAGYPIARVLMKGHGTTRVPVPMSDVALIALERWRAWLKRDKGPVLVALTKTLDPKTGQVTYKPGKAAISDQAIHKIIAGRGEEVGLHVHPHLFRHTFVTWRMAAGLAPHEVAAITGHKVSGIGALGGYVDMRAIGERARNTTPAWLKTMFAW